jgi:hemerythrin-like domain-containing protein
LKLTSTTYIRTPNAGREALTGTLRRLIELYPAHIWKEDYLLFPMAEKLLSEEEQKELSEQFARHECEIGTDIHHGFEQLAGRLLELICGEATTCHTA